MFECDSGKIYICDGYTGAAVPTVIYNEFFRPLSPIFCPLDDGQAAQLMPGNTLPKYCAPSGLGRVVNGEHCGRSVQFLPLLYQTGAKTPAQLVKVDGSPARLVCYNSDFIAAAVDLAGAGAEILASDNKFPALFFRGDYAEIIVMPIRPGEHLAPALEALQGVAV